MGREGLDWTCQSRKASGGMQTEMGCHLHARPPARHVSVIGKQAAHRDVVLWGKGPVKSDASLPAVAWPVEIGERGGRGDGELRSSRDPPS